MPETQTLDMSTVNQEIAAVLNTHGIDSQLGVPDFILSKFMVQSIGPLVEALDIAVLLMQPADGGWDYEGDEFDD